MRFKNFYIQEQEFNFDLNHFDDLEFFKDRIKYAKDNLKFIAQGSSRMVFELSPKWVLKLAKNEKGLIQNATESDTEIQKTFPDIVPNLKEEGKKDYWIVVEKCSKISPAQFKSLTGISLELFEKGLKEIHKLENGKIDKLSDDVKLEIKDESSFLNIVKDFMINFDMLPGDLTKISSWGEVNGKVKLLDPGLTEDTFNDMYRKK